MLISYMTIISFKIPDELDLVQNFKNKTEDIDDWVKEESSSFITYKKSATYSIEGSEVR